jgi:signal transduction histidine kinase
MRIRIFPSESQLARARRLRSVAFGTLAVVATALIVLIALEPSTAARRLISLTAVAVLIGAIHELNRHGHTTLASWCFVLGLIAVVTQRAWHTGGIYAPVLPLYVLFVLMGGVLLSRLGGIVATAACVMGAAMLVAGQFAGAITPARDLGTPIGMLLFLTMILGLSLMLQAMIGTSFREALDRAEHELAVRTAAETRLDLAMAAGRIAVWELDRERRSLVGDRRIGELYDAPVRDDGTVALDDVLRRVHPDDLPTVLARAESVRAGSGTAEHAHRLLAADGSIRYVRGASTAVPTADGGVRVVGVTMDVTDAAVADLDRKRLVHHLGERVKELRLLHQTAVAAQRPWSSRRELLAHVVTLMPEAWQYPAITEARITLGNDEVSTPGWRRTEWVQSVDFAAEGRDGVIEVAYTEPRPSEAEGPFLREERDLLTSFSEMLAAILNSQQSRRALEQLVETRTGELRTAHDAIAESLEQLRALEQVRDNLVQMIIHDQRGLLTVVMANLEFAQAGLTGQPAADVAEALRAAEAIERMANTVLDVSRLREEKMPLHRVPTDVAALASETARTYRALGPSRSIDCGAKSAVIATCDADLIRRVIENLVSNALKHAPSGGRVNVDVQATAGGCHVAVQDDGPGIPQDIRDTLFDKFTSARRGSKYHSAGIGLAFCRLAVEAHGGAISVQAAAPRGTIFSFTIPH